MAKLEAITLQDKIISVFVVGKYFYHKLNALLFLSLGTRWPYVQE